MKNHPTDRQLEYWLRATELLPDEERDEISAHLEECLLCSERIEMLESYFAKIDEKVNKPPSDRIKSIADKIYRGETRKLLSSNSLVKSYQKPLKTYENGYLDRLSNYIRIHPIRSVTIAAASSLLAFVLILMVPRTDKNPGYAAVENNILKVYNGNGELLWDITANSLPEEISSKNPNTGLNEQFISLTDIDGDERNEILIRGDRQGAGFAPDTLYCLNSDGTMRWKQGVPELISFGDMDHTESARMRIFNFLAYHPSNSENASPRPRLFALAKSNRWFPSVLFELNPIDGKILQRYWHSGNFSTITPYHSAEKNQNYLIVGGINNAFNKASISVLNPSDIDGYSPLTSEYQPNDSIKRANEKVYLTFEPTNLQKKHGTTAYNFVPEITITPDGNLLIRTHEFYRRLGDEKSGNIYYILDERFKVLDVYADDNFTKLYGELYEDGSIEKPLNEGIWEELKNAVRYWEKETGQFVPYDELSEKSL